MSRITKLVVGKGKTTRPSEQEEWVREYYELEIALEDPNELEIARANALGTIDAWLSRTAGAEAKEAGKVDTLYRGKNMFVRESYGSFIVFTTINTYKGPLRDPYFRSKPSKLVRLLHDPSIRLSAC